MFTRCSIVGLGARLYPRGLATATPQHFTVASSPDPNTSRDEFPTKRRTVGTHRIQPRSTRFELACPKEA